MKNATFVSEHKVLELDSNKLPMFLPKLKKDGDNIELISQKADEYVEELIENCVVHHLTITR